MKRPISGPDGNEFRARVVVQIEASVECLDPE